MSQERHGFVIVDTHCHAGTNWFEPVETLLFQMERNGVDKAVLVQFRGNYDSSYILDCTCKYPGRFAAVVLVDTKQPDALDKLEDWAGRGAVGVRLAPEEHSPGPDPLAVWRKASDLGLVVSSLGTLANFASDGFRDVVSSLPNLEIVIEHLAGATPDMDYSLFERAMRLAQYPNTYIKLPGFGEVLPRPFPLPETTFGAPPRCVRMAYEAFGARRMMWGSDYPPSGSREGYANALRFPLEHIDFFTAQDREWAFGQTALSVWRFA